MKDGNPSHKTPCVLVIDDEDYITDMIATLLEDEGFTTFKAYDGREGLAVVERYPVDMVITDIMMPNLDGNNLVRKLLAKEKTRKIPIVMISAGAYPADLPTNVWFIPKPFNIQTILDIVREAGLPSQ